MKRRHFLRTSFAAGVAGLAVPSTLKASPNILIKTPTKYNALGMAIPNPPYRLQFNENPRGLAPAAKKAIIDNFESASWYSTPLRGQLTTMIQTKHGTERGSIAMGNGSGDTLRQIPQAIGKDGMHLIAADPTYGDIFGSSSSAVAGLKTTRVPQRADYTHDIPAMKAALAANASAPVTLVYICQPNNPTGVLTKRAEIEQWINEVDESRVIFAIDEAYHHYVTDPAYKSFDDLTKTKKNVIVARTFSKIYAMAGVRCGYAVAHPETAAKLSRLFGGGVSHLTAAAAIASMEDPTWEKDSVRLNNEAREITYRGLQALNIKYIPTQTNFFMHEIKLPLADHTTKMRDQGLVVGRAFPPMTTWNRVTFGLPEQMTYFVETLKSFRTQGHI
jgi:histidinol-phosphate aminotransferase